MATDFFERQEAARRNTGRLVMLYVLAVLAIMVLVYLVVAFAILLTDRYGAGEPGISARLWRPDLLWKVGGGVLLVVLGATTFKILELAQGGQVVAQRLGGRVLNVGTRDAAERQVLNVVEEMSIASGVPVPPVYLMERESSINAFAAGYSPESAVIGVTRGTIDKLSRDQLQGVIAHEFSHILNGDMRLNIRLIGILHGILVIGLIGSMILRGAAYSGRSSRKGGGAAGLAMVGLALMILGYLGTFFGTLIKAAVSRQREFLADASAVDFTRNPGGIAGALKRIGARSGGSRLHHPRAAECSHMYFGNGVARPFSEAFATHPPLAERIRRIEPSWDGRFPELEPEPAPEPAAPPRAAHRPGRAMPVPPLGIPLPLAGAVLEGAVERVGRPGQDHLDHAVALLDRLPDELREAVHGTDGARAVAYAMLLDRREEHRTAQLDKLRQAAAPAAYDATVRLAPLVDAAGVESRIPLVDLVLPSLRQLEAREYETFSRNVDTLVLEDDVVEPFEWVLQRMLRVHLRSYFGGRGEPAVRHFNLVGVRDECVLLLSALARLGNPEESAALRAFREGARKLGMSDVKLLPGNRLSLEALDRAIEQLRALSPRYKRVVLRACAGAIEADRKITPAEAELFRAIADLLGVPVPPVLVTPEAPPA